jgi:hypothetical protein
MSIYAMAQVCDDDLKMVWIKKLEVPTTMLETLPSDEVDTVP